MRSCTTTGLRYPQTNQSQTRRTSNSFPGSSVAWASTPAHCTETTPRKRPVLPSQAATENVWETGSHSWFASSCGALGCEKIGEQFTSQLQLARIGFVADFEDGIGQHLSAFRCRFGTSRERIWRGRRKGPN